MSGEIVGVKRYYFPSQEELTSYLEKHPSTKDLKIATN